MRLSKFRVENQRNIRLAECSDVPKLMVIAGPNGTGKSTLLNALRFLPGTGRILYVGPHRNARRQTVQWRHLQIAPIFLQDLLARSDVPGLEGVNLVTGARDPWSFDDTANFLKHGLCQIEVERKDAIAALYDRDHQIAKDSLPDPWAPLKELTSNLLPHLSFAGIDSSNRNQVRVLWRVHAKDTVVDLDDLSSGEKAIIQIFYPLLEARTKEILRQIQQTDSGQAQPEICVLIDEPELHLHPNLQIKVFDYLRLLTTDGRTQVIIATHSPTIVEYASFEELYLLRPAEIISSGDNQLIPVASDEERLNFLRNVFGTTSNLTALQPVIIVEGVEQTDSSKTVSDRKLYRALHPGFDRITLVAGGGKSECIRLQQTLEKALRGFSTSVKAVTLLDRDLATGEPSDGVTYLTVSMIENFLIDPMAIWESLQSVIEKTPFKTIDDIANAIDELLDELTASEIERRAIQTLGTAFFRPGPFVEIPKQEEKFIEEFTGRYSSETLKKAIETSTKQVEDLRLKLQRREYFHGKNFLSAFSRKYLHQVGMSNVIFHYEAARHARARKKVVQFFDTFFSKALPEISAPVIVAVTEKK